MHAQLAVLIFSKSNLRRSGVLRPLAAQCRPLALALYCRPLAPTALQPLAVRPCSLRPNRRPLHSKAPVNSKVRRAQPRAFLRGLLQAARLLPLPLLRRPLLLITRSVVELPDRSPILCLPSPLRSWYGNCSLTRPGMPLFLLFC